MGENKICPILSTSSILNKELVSCCEERRCAWWVDFPNGAGCALPVIAASLFPVAEYASEAVKKLR